MATRERDSAVCIVFRRWAGRALRPPIASFFCLNSLRCQSFSPCQFYLRSPYWVLERLVCFPRNYYDGDRRFHDSFAARARSPFRVCYACALRLAPRSREGLLLVTPRLRFSDKLFTCEMSKVRVSNGSPTLERVDPRQADHGKPPVCRSLFGAVDRQEFAKDVREQMREIERASAEKWNYDFAENRPLAPGDYEWQEVDADEVPDFYTRPPRVKRPSSAGTVDHNGNHDYFLTAPSPSPESGAGNSERADAGNRSLSTPRKRPSTEDQDDLRRSKRPSVHASEADPCPDATSSLERAPCEPDPKT